MKPNKYISLYWKCQLIGWMIASLYWAFQGWTSSRFRVDLAVVQFVSDVVMYITITHLYRIFALHNQWQNLALKALVWRMLVAIPVMGVLYTAVTIGKLYLVRSLFSSYDVQTFEDFFNQNGVGIFMAGIRLMAIWLLAYHLYHYAKREIRLSAENSQLQLATKQAQLDGLAAQLNPHFLFNALNTIKSLVFTDPRSAGRAIDLMSEVLRSGLYNGNAVMVSLGDEISLVRDYLELEQLRMEERLSFDLDIDLALSRIMLPRLSLQTLVENAVKHGVAQEKVTGKITIEVKEETGYLTISVLNPGKLNYNENKGIGVRNLRERLQISYQGRATLTLFEMGDKVSAILKIPMS